MNCLCSGEQMQVKEMAQSSEFLSTKDVLVDQYMQQNSEVDQRVDIGNIEEAESSLREGLCLNYEVGLKSFLAPFYGGDEPFISSDAHACLYTFNSNVDLCVFAFRHVSSYHTLM